MHRAGTIKKHLWVSLPKKIVRENSDMSENCQGILDRLKCGNPEKSLNVGGFEKKII